MCLCALWCVTVSVALWCIYFLFAPTSHFTSRHGESPNSFEFSHREPTLQMEIKY